jgi:transcriptional regulator with XRE-family HTH domain
LTTSKNRIDHALEMSGKSRSDLATSLGVSRSSVSDMLNKPGEATMKYIQAAADLTGFSFEWLRTGIGPSKGPASNDSEVSELRARIAELEKENDVLRSALREIGSGKGGGNPSSELKRNVG